LAAGTEVAAKLSVDYRACLKSGQCTYLHPELFKERADGYPDVLVPELPEDLREAAEDAAELCPGQAIVIEE
jgi:ferredoxin